MKSLGIFSNYIVVDERVWRFYKRFIDVFNEIR